MLRKIAHRALIRRAPTGFSTRSLTTNISSWNCHTKNSNLRFLSSSNERREQRKHQSPLRFEDLGLHPKSLKALRRHGLHKLTEIQHKSFDTIVSGKDVVGRARTGTGKTLAFLLPSLERLLVEIERDKGSPGIQMLVLSPTRELAAQIAKEADRLVATHESTITSQVVYGGASKKEDIDSFNQQLPTILVATPGRLKDHLASTYLKGNKPFIDSLQNLKILVLDETDRLLDLGFRNDIQDILACLPKEKRQTLLFSATLPPKVREIVEIATKPNYEVVDCIQEGDPASHTNAQTEQSYITLPSQRFWTGSMEMLLEMMDQGKSKIMVFFPLTGLVQLYANIFNLKFGRRVWELHGKMNQRERIRISRRFRNATNGILFTSDVSARGVDYPNVTNVVQIGASDSRETYIHRLGRTGRAGKRGKGFLILPELEQDFVRDLEGLDISCDQEMQERLCKGASRHFRNELGPVAQDMRAGRDPKLEQSVNDAYQAMVSYYFHRSEDDEKFVSTVNHLVEDMGLRELPAIDYHRARKIGLDKIPGLNIQQNWKDQSWTGSWVAPKTDYSRKPFDKSYGDLNGNLEKNNDSFRLARTNSWNGPTVTPKSRPRRHSWNTGDTFRDDRERRNGKAFKEHSAGKRRGGSQNKGQFVKLGYEKDPLKQSRKITSRNNQKGVFKRWEAPGEWSLKGE